MEKVRCIMAKGAIVNWVILTAGYGFVKYFYGIVM
jgi:hypothetical protein